MLNIRNFSIIAHIDHGKSTLSDRIIQFCGGLQQRDMHSRILDSMDLERERGITIKAQSVTLNYASLNGLLYRLNFIDTPGHVDFSYEVSRSLFACEGVLLLVDASQGVQAQTLAHARMALEMSLAIVLVLNKIDLFTADIKGVCSQIEDIIGIDTTNVVLCSAKTGVGISDLLESLVRYIPSPMGNINSPFQALIIDAWFDKYCGVVFLICVKNGILRKGDKVKFMSTGCSYFVDKLGIFTPKSVERKVLYCGEVGWFVCIIKDVFSSLVGDTLISHFNTSSNVLPSFKKIIPKVYASFFLVDSSLQNNFRLAIHKLSLNDSAFSYEPESSLTFGYGFRCGFLGTLHMEVVQARLEREYSLALIRTTPMVLYEVLTCTGEVIYLNSAEQYLSTHCIKELREPIVNCSIFLQQEHIGDIMSLCISRRGKNVKIMSYSNQIILTCDLPMAEVMLGFFDRVKAITSGYGSFDYSFKKFQISDLICLEILINGKRIDALATITHRHHINYRCKEFLVMLHKIIPRQQFDIVIQAAIGKRVISRLVVKQLRKDVTSKCYGGDITRKKKLILKQKFGKKRMKNLGNVRLPLEVFMTNINMIQYGK